MRQLRILHVSDIHFGADAEAQAFRIRAQLIKAARHHYVNSPPDIIVFTGDIADKAKASEYALATKWVDDLVVDWDDTKIFIVPGNHDVNRPGEERRQEELGKIRKYSKSQRVWPPHEEVELFQSNFSAFLEWHRNLKTAHPSQVISDWDEKMRVSNARFAIPLNESGTLMQEVAIIGLNTALLSYDDSDKDFLLADETDLNVALGSCDPDRDLVVVATHHPIAPSNSTRDRWLAAWNNQAIERALLQTVGAHLHLHGHLHRTSAAGRGMSNGQFLATLAAGAAYQHPSYPMMFGCYELAVIRNSVTVSTYAWSRDSGLWGKNSNLSGIFHATLPSRASDDSRTTLETSLRLLSPHVTTGRPAIDAIVEKQSGALLRSLESAPTGRIEVDTHVLYREIVEALAFTGSDSEADINIIILDQDVNRWNELLDDADKIAYNTFNYSREILEKSKAVAELRPNYRVTRVFALDEDADINDAVARKRIAEIFESIQMQIPVAGRPPYGTSMIGNRISNQFVIAGRQDPHIVAELRNSGDFVLVTRSVNRNSEKVLFREQLTFDRRSRADDTRSSISVRDDDVGGAAIAFQEILKVASPISSFGTLSLDGVYEGSRSGTP